MRTRVFLIILGLFVLQMILIAFLILRPSLSQPVERTPIPTLALATLPASESSPQEVSVRSGECQIRALDLIGAWVAADKPETEEFEFQDTAGDTCQATFEQDVSPLFNQPNIWYAGSLACTNCHGSDVAQAAGQLSLSDYQSIVAGSRRESANSTGQDILGNEASWEQSRLFIMIHSRAMPIGRPPTSPERGPLVTVGKKQ